MKLFQLNEYVQTAAAIVAIIGIFMLGYELRLSNRITISQQNSTSWSNWLDYAAANMDSRIAATLAKSMTDPDKLTLEDKINLGFYLEAYTYGYAHDVTTIQTYDNDAAAIKDILDELAAEAPRYFGSRYARAWLEENRDFLSEELSAAITEGLQSAPLNSDRAYFDRIDERAAAME